jgi:hypothetical protein
MWGMPDEEGGIRGETMAHRVANARRIVECVNALEGIPNPAAIAGVVAALEAQTTQLMIARGVIDQAKILWMGEDRAAEIQQQARDALASLRGAA